MKKFLIQAHLMVYVTDPQMCFTVSHDFTLQPNLLADEISAFTKKILAKFTDITSLLISTEGCIDKTVTIKFLDIDELGQYVEEMRIFPPSNFTNELQFYLDFLQRDIPPSLALYLVQTAQFKKQAIAKESKRKRNPTRGNPL